MSTTTNYTLNGGVRKVDLYIMGPYSFKESTLQLTKPTLASAGGGQVCAGIVKLAQKVVGVLLSYNLYYDLDWGTQLFPFILSGNGAQVHRLLPALMAGATAAVVAQIRGSEPFNLPDDERIGNFRMTDYTYDRLGGRVSVVLGVTSRSNEQISVVTPISIVP